MGHPDKKINKETSEFHLITHFIQHTLFLAAHGKFFKINHILGHKASLNIFKKIEIRPCIRSDHNGIKLELSKKRNYRKYSDTWRLNNTLE
jgi:hypothetical protein